MTRVWTIPPPAPGEANPWQCAAPTAKTPAGVHWLRNSLEYCRLSVNVYDEALAAAQRMARTHRPRRWLVLMDADETVLDNSLFERERQRCGGEFKERAMAQLGPRRDGVRRAGRRRFHERRA